MWTNAVRAPPAVSTATALTPKAPSAAVARRDTGHRRVGPDPVQVGWAPPSPQKSLGVGTVPGQSALGEVEAGRSGCGKNLGTNCLGYAWGEVTALWAGFSGGLARWPRSPALSQAYLRHQRVSGGRLLLSPWRMPQHRRLLCLYLCPRLPAWTPRIILSWSVLELGLPAERVGL